MQTDERHETDVRVCFKKDCAGGWIILGTTAQTAQTEEDSYVAMGVDEGGNQRARRRWKLRLKPNCGPAEAYRHKPGAQSRQFRADKTGVEREGGRQDRGTRLGAKNGGPLFPPLLLWRSERGIVTV